MDRLFRLLLENPFLLLVLVAWIGGAIANVLRATKRAKERTEQARRDMGRRDEARAQRTAAEPVSTEPRTTEPSRSAEDVAAEMRRILGMDGPLPRSARRSPSLPEVAVELPPSTPPPRRPLRTDVVLPERAPRPVVPTTQSRSLELHGDSHVGDAIRSRHLTTPSARHGAAVGNLGGRVPEGHTVRRRSTSRYAIEDLKKAFIVNEILGPPLSLRGTEERLR